MSGGPAAKTTCGDFLKIDIRIGTIVAAEVFPEACKPALKLRVDFGREIGIKRSYAQITEYYTPKELVGRQVAAVVNLPPRQIGPVRSEVLVLGSPDPDGKACLVGVDPTVPNGGRLF